MHFTFYIDESGNFEDGKKDWVVAGLLLPLPRVKADEALNEACNPLPRKFGLFGRSEFHLTELKARDLEKAMQVADGLLSSVESACPNFQFVATVNRASHLTEKTKTYRVMLIDLIALVDTLLPTNIKDGPITGLDFVIASRVIDGTRAEQQANIGELTEHSLQAALEVDLASRGLVSWLKSGACPIDVRQANEQWGTICADFVANLIFNKNTPESGVRVDSLREKNKLRVFQGMGNYQERRARIAERDGELVTALYRWGLLGKQKGSRKHERSAEMQRLCERILTETGSTGPRWSIGILIDLVHRNKSLSLPRRVDIVAEVHSSLRAAAEKQGLAQERVAPLSLRLLNYQLLSANKSGNVLLSEQLIKDLEPVLKSHALNPDEFSAVLNSHAYAVESALNDMNNEEATRRADRYSNLSQRWRDVWSLLHSDTAENEAKSLKHFDSSAEGIKAKSASLRVRIRQSVPEDPTLDALAEEVAQAEGIAESLSDRNRLHCYRMSALLRCGRCHQATEIGRKALNVSPEDSFIQFWLARSLGDCLLSGDTELPEAGIFLEETILAEKLEHYPQALLWREVGLLRKIVKNKATEQWLYPLESSSAFFKADAHLSALNRHLHELSEQHIAFCRKTSFNFHDCQQLVMARRRSPE